MQNLKSITKILVLTNNGKSDKLHYSIVKCLHFDLEQENLEKCKFPQIKANKVNHSK